MRGQRIGGVINPVFHEGHTLVDEVRSWGDIVAGQGGVHIPLHIRQLRALAGRPAAT